MNQRFHRRLSSKAISVFGWSILPLLLAMRLACDFAAPPTSEGISEGTHHVRRTIDGDTLLLGDGRRVRLIGVNAPESVRPNSPVEPCGVEAAEFTQRFVAGGSVRLQLDRERIDRYGRLLAYVWVGDRMLNEELLRAGLARATLQYHFSETMKRRFRAAQDEARAARRGIWAKEGG